MNQLADTLEAAGFTPGDVTMLRSSPLLSDFRNILLGHAQIVAVKHVIDLDAYPFVPRGLKVKEHIKGGQFEWDPVRVALYLSAEQQQGGAIRGYKLRDELRGKPAYNANLLDYLLAHQELIPEYWMGKKVFFWGTTYNSSNGRITYVRFLGWDDGWYWHCHSLQVDFRDNDPAAVPASI